MQHTNDTTIRLLEQKDIALIPEIFNFPWTTQEVSLEKWQNYLREQENNARSVFIIEKNQQVVGYCSLIYQSLYANFKNENIPEINDLWILESERCNGLGLKLITHIEEFAKALGYKTIGLGVGLYRDYGSAQRLYVKNGYIPDGEGLTYKNEAVTPGQSYPIDDDLVLWLVKKI